MAKKRAPSLELLCLKSNESQVKDVRDLYVTCRPLTSATTPGGMLFVLDLLNRDGRLWRLFLLTSGSGAPSMWRRPGSCAVAEGGEAALGLRKDLASRTALDPFGSWPIQKSLETDMFTRASFSVEVIGQGVDVRALVCWKTEWVGRNGSQ